MALRNQVEWALYCCVTIASLSPKQYVSTKTLAEFYRLPKAYLSKALQRLSKASIVETTSGPAGGYRLAKRSDAITVLDIIEAISGAEPLFIRSDILSRLPFPVPDFLSAGSPVDRVMETADEHWRCALRTVKLADLVLHFQQENNRNNWERNLLWLAARTD